MACGMQRSRSMTTARHDEHEHTSEEETGDLQELLAETRILLPGTEVFLGFLATLPFSNRFAQLGRGEQEVYIATFFATMLAFVCFVTPAAYHRLARPIHHKAAFKRFANTFLVIGLAPVSVSVVLASFLVTSVAIGRAHAYFLAAGIAVVVSMLWWVIPLTRAHDRFTRRVR
jgi:hypothetical protein